MYTQKIFKTGNSQVVAIPSYLSKSLNMNPGTEVIVSKSEDGQGVVIRKVSQDLKVADRPNPIDKEFKTWLKDVMKEDEEILDKLSVR